jgi:hypothetical protein
MLRPASPRSPRANAVPCREGSGRGQSERIRALRNARSEVG